MILPAMTASWHLPGDVQDIVPGEVHLWRARCMPAQLDPAMFARLLTAPEVARAERFATPELRRRYLQAHALLHTVLAAYLPADSPRCEFGYQTEGKPYLVAPQLEPELAFNMSHAGEMVLIALARGSAVGVDVELVRPLTDLDALAGASCSTREQAYLAALADEARLGAFYRLWTRKEAWLKLQGKGIAGGLRAADVLTDLAGVTLYDVTLDAVLLDDMTEEHRGEYVAAVALPSMADAKATRATIRLFEASWHGE